MASPAPLAPHNPRFPANPSPEKVHVIELKPSYVTQLLHASDLALVLGRVGESDRENLVDGFPERTAAGKQVDGIFGGDGAAGYFMRFGCLQSQRRTWWYDAYHKHG